MSERQSSIRGNLFAVAAIISLSAAVAAVVCTTVVANAYRARLENPRRESQALNVTGSARRRIKSDLAVWRITVTAEGEDQKAAYAKLKESTDKLAAFLDKKKFLQSEIAPGAISSEAKQPASRRTLETRGVTGFTLRRTYTLTSPRVDAVASVSAEATELIQDSVELVSSEPEFYYTKISDLKIEMIGEASKDARSRADQIVTKAGCAIAEVRNARMGVLQITRPESTETASGGMYDTSTVDKDVTAVVSLTFGLAN